MPLVAAGILVAATVIGAVGACRAGAQAAYSQEQWGLTQISAPAAWAYGTGTGVRIGIVDTGVDSSQQDLAGKVVAATTILSDPGSGCATASEDPDGEDDYGHGTHVAGIAAARGVGVSGVAPGASLVVAKVLDCTGSGSLTDVAAGVAWVVQHGARVINLSIGADPGFAGINCALGACDESTLEDAANQAWADGAIPVIAAGNNGNSLDLIAPAGYGDTNAVVVAATGPSGSPASYTSTPGDSKWGVLAPGGDSSDGAPTCGTVDPDEILSTYWTSSNDTNCYATDEGTSMATPFVTGTLALLLGRGLTQTQAVSVLMSTLNTADTCGSGNGCQGLVDAGAAMAEANRLLPAPGAPAGAPTTPPRAASAVAATTGPAGSTRSVSPAATGATPAAAAAPTTAPGATSPSATTAPSTGRKAVALGHRSGGAGAGGWIAAALVSAVAAAAAGVELARRRARVASGGVHTVESPAEPPADVFAG